MHTTPPSLLERLRQPAEQQAWERFVELYTPLIYYWAHRVGLEGHDAADLVQDVFTVLVQKLPEFHYDPQKSFRSWLHTVTSTRGAIADDVPHSRWNRATHHSTMWRSRIASTC
jgi:RNA polymerase sigma-70 factor (ECF subfamily)